MLDDWQSVQVVSRVVLFAVPFVPLWFHIIEKSRKNHSHRAYFKHNDGYELRQLDLDRYSVGFRFEFAIMRVHKIQLLSFVIYGYTQDSSLLRK